VARGQKEAANQQLATTNAAATGAGANAAAINPAVTAGYMDLVKNPGYDQTTKNAMAGTAFAAGNEAYDTASAGAAGKVSRTRNDAGYADLLDSMSRGRAETSANTGAGLQKIFADNAQAQQQAGLKGLAGLYGIDEDTMAKLYGLGPGTLQARAAGPPPFSWNGATGLNING
jgi:hypothetical protein